MGDCSRQHSESGGDIMYFEVENSGVCKRKGLVQVRYSLYLEPDDVRYDEFYVDVPDITEKYNGTEEDYSDWLKSLQTKKQLNPFHNHFSYFPDTVTDEEILTEGNRILEAAKPQFKSYQTPDIKHKSKPVFSSNVDVSKKANIESKILSIKSKKLTNKQKGKP